MTATIHERSFKNKASPDGKLGPAEAGEAGL
jgi:hypothetical protein